LSDWKPGPGGCWDSHLTRTKRQFDKRSEAAGGSDIRDDSGENLDPDWDAIPRTLGSSADTSMVAKALRSLARGWQS
jgi:hypothetical protein